MYWEPAFELFLSFCSSLLQLGLRPFSFRPYCYHSLFTPSIFLRFWPWDRISHFWKTVICTGSEHCTILLFRSLSTFLFHYYFFQFGTLLSYCCNLPSLESRPTSTCWEACLLLYLSTQPTASARMSDSSAALPWVGGYTRLYTFPTSLHLSRDDVVSNKFQLLPGLTVWNIS